MSACVCMLNTLNNRPSAVPSAVLKTTVILSVREGGLLNFRKVRSTNPSPSSRLYDTGSNPIGITAIRLHCVHLWEREGRRERGRGMGTRDREGRRWRREENEIEDEYYNKSDVYNQWTIIVCVWEGISFQNNANCLPMLGHHCKCHIKQWTGSEP